jgi:hypothetical protein
MSPHRRHHKDRFFLPFSSKEQPALPPPLLQHFSCRALPASNAMAQLFPMQNLGGGAGMLPQPFPHMAGGPTSFGGAPVQPQHATPSAARFAQAAAQPPRMSAPPSAPVPLPVPVPVAAPVPALVPAPATPKVQLARVPASAPKGVQVGPRFFSLELNFWVLCALVIIVALLILTCTTHRRVGQMTVAVERLALRVGRLENVLVQQYSHLRALGAR